MMLMYGTSFESQMIGSTQLPVWDSGLDQSLLACKARNAK